ncbi:MAG: zinc-binding alcohol dehydrogenase, partial [Deltaproteobacteria bacterium]|nr:zinc-binding alcohol dehydrogenase [Deltaproteobacteria bacterium]
MRQLVQNLKNGTVEFLCVPYPSPRGGHVTISVWKSLISPGTERMLLEFGKANWIEKARMQPEKVRQVIDKIKTDGLISTLEAVFRKLDEPLPLGYSNVGTVVEVGEGVTEFQIGDRVVSNGPHAEFVCVPKNLCAKIPDDVTDDEAVFTVLGSIALQGIRLANPTFGESFMVFGVGLLGLLTIQLLRANGCKVLAVDINEKRLELAKEFGAEVVNSKISNDPETVAHTWTKGIGVDGVIITASTKGDTIIHQAAQSCRKRGRIVLVGVVDLNLRRSDFYEKELTFQVSCSYGPGRYDESYEQGGQDYPIGYVRWTEKRNFEAVLEAIRSGQLKTNKLVTH